MASVPPGRSARARAANADLGALARVDGLVRGDVFRPASPGRAFEHFAKERCLLPARAFPYDREHAVETPWWRLGERLRKLPKSSARGGRKRFDLPERALPGGDFARGTLVDGGEAAGCAREDASTLTLELLSDDIIYL